MVDQKCPRLSCILFHDRREISKVFGGKVPNEDTKSQDRFDKKLDWSTLTSGVTLPKCCCEAFLGHLSKKLAPGNTAKVKLCANGTFFNVSLGHVKFSSGRPPVVQFRWPTHSPIAEFLQCSFPETFDILQSDHSCSKRITEIIFFSLGAERDVFVLSWDIKTARNSEETMCIFREDSLEPVGSLPILDVEQWEKFLRTDSIIPAWGVELLRKWIERDRGLKEASPNGFADLQEQIRETKKLGKKIRESAGCPIPMTREGITSWLSIFLVRRNSIEKGRLWGVQPELLRAWDIVFPEGKSQCGEVTDQGNPAKVNESSDNIKNIPPLELTSKIINTILEEGLLKRDSEAFQKLKTIQWCQNVLHIRYPLIRELRFFESAQNFRESFVPLAGKYAETLLLCKNQAGLDIDKFLEWALSAGMTTVALAKLLGKDVQMKASPVFAPEKPRKDILSNDVSETPPEDVNPAPSYPHFTCDEALLTYISAHPGEKESTIISALEQRGYDREKIIRRISRMPEIIRLPEGVFLQRGAIIPSGTPVPTTPPKTITLQRGRSVSLSAPIETSAPDKIDATILEYIKSNAGARDSEVIAALEQDGYQSEKISSRLKRLDDVLIIAGHCHIRNDIVGLDKAADILLSTLRELFNRNNGYTSAHELFKSVQAQLDDFFYDNDAFESEMEVYQLAEYLLGNDHYKDAHFIFKSNIHIWEREPDYPMGDHGLLILWARENNGILTTQYAFDNYRRRGVNAGSISPTFSMSMEKVFDQFWMVNEGTYFLKEKVAISADFLEELREQINILMAEFDFGFIPMWDIGLDWYTGLPSLGSGYKWTPLLLQSIIRDHGEYLGARTIPRQDVRQLHAAIVRKQSDIQFYSDLIYWSIRKRTSAKSVSIDRNELFEWLIEDGLWPQEITPSYGLAFQNLFKDNIHFHVTEKNKLVVV